MRSEEEHGHCHAQKDAADATVDEQERIVGTSAIDVAHLVAVFIAHGLKDETEENQHP
jgi:hypothetical protein